MVVESRQKPSEMGGSSSKRKRVSSKEHLSQEWHVQRKKIGHVLSLFRKSLMDKRLLAKFKHESSSFGMRVTGLALQTRVFKALETSGAIYKCKEVGEVLGIKVGDKFHFRLELSIAGLHHDFLKGIDYMSLPFGKTVATCIVDSGRYDNIMGTDFNTLIYCGESENHGTKPLDQKLRGGNLALNNNMEYKLPVRVIRKFMNFNTFTPMAAAVEGNDRSYMYVYIGLYHVTKCWQEKGEFKFSLLRIDDQPKLDLSKLNIKKTSSVGTSLD